uniref:Secreted protein n=1 Tax=Denticeps clupeoides TaxID=299321 RepID=A0AAY4E6K1_9TELE
MHRWATHLLFFGCVAPAHGNCRTRGFLSTKGCSQSGEASAGHTDGQSPALCPSAKCLCPRATVVHRVNNAEATQGPQRTTNTHTVTLDNQPPDRENSLFIITHTNINRYDRYMERNHNALEPARRRRWLCFLATSVIEKFWVLKCCSFLVQLPKLRYDETSSHKVVPVTNGGFHPFGTSHCL